MGVYMNTHYTMEMLQNHVFHVQSTCCHVKTHEMNVDFLQKMTYLYNVKHSGIMSLNDFDMKHESNSMKRKHLGY